MSPQLRRGRNMRRCQRTQEGVTRVTRRSSKRDPELRPAALPVLQREREAVIVQDFRDDGEAEAAAFALGGEEGREKLVARGRIDSAAGVGNGEHTIVE